MADASAAGNRLRRARQGAGGAGGRRQSRRDADQLTTSRTVQIAVAFAIVYIVWGSTYLAIRIGVQVLPPGLFNGLRFVIAGILMLGYAFARGARLPASRRDWGNIAITALLMLVGGNGCVTWAEQWIESNQAALIVATSALWLAWMGTWGAHGERLSGPTLLGLGLGFGGVATLVQSGLRLGGAPGYAYAGLALAPVLWSAGSVWARRRPVACAPNMTAALQMLIAGAVFGSLGLGTGELPRWNWDTNALLALAYLAVFGSCLAYGAYVWLVHQVPPATLGTYAYVNPAIAVLLGWWILDESLNATQILGTAIILAGVVLVTWAARKPKGH